jgi:DNA-binding transcriptional MerR regulator
MGHTMTKAKDAFRTISEVAAELDVPKHVLRFWEVKFPQIRPMKRGGGRRYYRPEDLELLYGVRALLHGDGYTIRGVQRILKERGIEEVKSAGRQPLEAAAARSAADAARPGRSGDKGVVAGAGGHRRRGKAQASVLAVAERQRQLRAAVDELMVCRQLLIDVRAGRRTVIACAGERTEQG